MRLLPRQNSTCIYILIVPAATAFAISKPDVIPGFQIVSFKNPLLKPLNAVNDLFREDFDNERGKAKKGRSKSVASDRFASGEELKSLRMDLESLRENLQWAIALDGKTEDLRKAIKNGEKRDPDVAFKKAKKEIAKAKAMTGVTTEERDELVQKWTGVANEARHFLPQFALEGLWVGDYGGHGYQLVNVTYDGDTLVGTKVTGDNNVPRGEATFSADLSMQNEAKSLPPIKLSRHSNTGMFDRFPGEGQISRKGFKDPRHVEGQLILLAEGKFSFLWVPTKHHIFFSRPSPEMTMRLLRDVLSKEDEIENMRSHVARCFEMDMTTCIARQHDPANFFEPFRRISTQEELDKAEKKLRKTELQNRFWQLHKWRVYIDKVLDGEPLQ